MAHCIDIQPIPLSHTSTLRDSQEGESPSFHDKGPAIESIITTTTTTTTYPSSETLTPPPTSSLSSRIHRNFSQTLPSKPTLLRDLILGFADGLTVPFALCAGLSSLENSRIVVLAGLAELFSGAISMGLGCYLAAVTEAKVYDDAARELAERFRGGEDVDVERGQRDGEDVFGVLEGYGVGRGEAVGVVKGLMRRREMWVKFMLDFSLKTEKPAVKGAWVEGIVMGFSYFIGGLLPMIPYFCTYNTLHALIASIVLTAVILLIFGYVKESLSSSSSAAAEEEENDEKEEEEKKKNSSNTKDAKLQQQQRRRRRSRRANVLSALHTLAVGIVAAGTSYGIVRGLNGRGNLE